MSVRPMVSSVRANNSQRPPALTFEINIETDLQTSRAVHTMPQERYSIKQATVLSVPPHRTGSAMSLNYRSTTCASRCDATASEDICKGPNNQPGQRVVGSRRGA